MPGTGLVLCVDPQRGAGLQAVGTAYRRHARVGPTFQAEMGQARSAASLDHDGSSDSSPGFSATGPPLGNSPRGRAPHPPNPSLRSGLDMEMAVDYLADDAFRQGLNNLIEPRGIGGLRHRSTSSKAPLQAWISSISPRLSVGNRPLVRSGERWCLGCPPGRTTARALAR